MNAYWRKRWERENELTLNGAIDATCVALQRAYLQTANKLVDSMVAKAARLAEENPTANTAYQLKRDAAMLKQIVEELKALGMSEEALLKSSFEDVYTLGAEVADKFIGKVRGEPVGLYGEINKKAANRAINAVTGSDEKTWSQRLWGSVNSLHIILESDLTRAIATGEGPMKLTARLMQDFSVSYSAARRLAVTEMTRVYNLAALDRMKKAGVERWKWYTAQDEKVCKVCAALDGKLFPIDDENVPPLASHPQCRCTILADI